MLETTICIAVVIGLVAVAKGLGMPSRFAPLAAVVLAVGLNFVIKYLGFEVGELLIGGIISGLTACGLYDVGKTTILDL